ncbi:MAG TPA: DUF1249 domain-containing protein [Pseudomonadales bacterium]
MSQSQYKIRLGDYMAECEVNYRRLASLLAAHDDRVDYCIRLPGDRSGRLTITVQERCKYTSMVSLSLSHSAPYTTGQQFELRVYHDARMVEVVAYQQQRRIQPRYPYPNQRMLQQDEKWQQHRFLSQCLRYCVENGLAPVVDRQMV